MSLGDITEFILENGTPVIIATDVNPVPSLVKKVSTAFNARLNVPSYDLPVRKKNRLTQRYGDKKISDHSKDALAAAIQALKDEKDLIKKIEKKTADLEEDKTRKVMKKTIKEEKSITNVLNDVKSEEKDETDGETEKINIDIDWEKRSKRLNEELERKEKEIERLKDYRDELKKIIREKNDKISQLSSERQSKIDRDEEVKRWKKRYENILKNSEKKGNKIKKLNKKIEKLLSVIKRIKSGEKLYKIHGSKDEIRDNGEPVLFVQKNVELNPPSYVNFVVVFKEEEKSFYEDKGIKTVLIDDLEGVLVEDYFVTGEEKIMSQLEDEKDGFMDWLEDYRERKDDRKNT